MTVCNATVGHLSSLLPGRLELRRGRGRRGNAEGRGQDGHSLGGTRGNRSRESLGARQSPARICLGGSKAAQPGSGCWCLPGLPFTQLLPKFYIPGPETLSSV